MKGNFEMNPDDLELNEGYIWDGGWQVVKNSSTDVEGWKYAASFKSHFKKNRDSYDTVRRRFWYRNCYKFIEE